MTRRGHDRSLPRIECERPDKRHHCGVRHAADLRRGGGARAVVRRVQDGPGADRCRHLADHGFLSHRRSNHVVHRRFALRCARSQAARGRRSAIRLASLRAVYLASQRSRLANRPYGARRVVRPHHERDLGFHARLHLAALSHLRHHHRQHRLFDRHDDRVFGHRHLRHVLTQLYPHVRRAHRADDAQRRPASACTGNGHASDHHPQGHQTARAYPEEPSPGIPACRGMLYRGMGHRRVLPIAVNPCRRDVFPIHRPADPRAHVCAGHGPERAGRAHVRPHHHAIRRIRRHGAAVHQLRDLVGYAHEGHDGAVPDHRRCVQRFHRHPPVRQHAYAHQLQRPR